MHTLTAHEGRMPSPDKFQNKPGPEKDAEPDNSNTIGQVSFTDTFVDTSAQENDLEGFTNQIPNSLDLGLVAVNQDDPSTSIRTPVDSGQTSSETTQTSQANDLPMIHVPEMILESGTIEPDLVEETISNVETKRPSTEMGYAAVPTVKVIDPNARTNTPSAVVIPPSASLGGSEYPQGATHRSRQTPQDEFSFENYTRYVKTGEAQTLPSQTNLASVQSGVPAFEIEIGAIVQTSLSAPMAPSNFQTPVPIQGQVGFNVITVPIGDVVSNVVHATLKQDRTLIRIDPPELGRIQIDFDHSGSGKTLVTLSAENDAVKLMLMERRAMMIGLFEAQGLEDIEIHFDSNFESGSETTAGQYFSNRDENAKLNDAPGTTESSLTSEGESSIGSEGNRLSALRFNNSRLNIRV